MHNSQNAILVDKQVRKTATIGGNNGNDVYEYTLSKAYSSNESSPIVKEKTRQIKADNCAMQSFAAAESNKSSSRRAKYLQAATTQAETKEVLD